MGFDKNLFEDSYELEALAELSEYPIPDEPKVYKRRSLYGYKKGIDNFYRIVRVFRYEMGYLTTLFGENTIFDKTYRILYSRFFEEFKEKNDVSSALVRYVKELETQPYRFDTIRAKNPFVNDIKGRVEDIEISVPQVCGLIGKLRKHRIMFYNCILQEYLARKCQYNQKLREHAKKNATAKVMVKAEEIELEGSLCSFSFKPDFESDNNESSMLSEVIYMFVARACKLKDLVKLGVSTREEYDNAYKNIVEYRYLNGERLPQYRFDDVRATKRVIDHLFLIFSIFKAEMSYILTTDLDKSFFEKTLHVLIRDFSSEFARKGDLANTLTDYIEELEKYKFFSLERSELYDNISQMLIFLRQHHIMFYEVILQEYRKNKAQYDDRLTRAYSITKANEAKFKRKDKKINKVESPSELVEEEIRYFHFSEKETKFTGKYPNEIDTLQKRLYYHLFRKEKEEAIKTGRLLIKHNPGDGDFHSIVGEALTEFGEYEEAIIVLQKALELEPLGWFMHDTYYHLAKCYIGLRDFGLARESLDKGDIATKKRYFSIEMMREWKEKKKKILAEIDDLR